MLFNVQDFSKHVLRLVGCSNLHSAFPQAHWARKSTWFRAKSLQSPTGRTSKNFWIFQKSHHNTQEARVCAGSAVSSPKLTEILGTRRFTNLNADLSCAPSTQFHLGTDVRYDYAPKYAVFQVFFKVAVHWNELASSKSLQQRKN